LEERKGLFVLAQIFQGSGVTNFRNSYVETTKYT